MCTGYSIVPMALFVLFGLVLSLVLWEAWYCELKWDPIPESSAAVVTGGANGLGKALVKNLLNIGVSHVFIIDIVPPVNADPRTTYLECDLSRPEIVVKCIESLLEMVDSQNLVLSVLINNAGIRAEGPILDIPMERVRQAFETNFYSPVYLMKTVINHYFAKEGTHQMYVVTVSLVLGMLAPRNLSTYSASKAALILAHEALAIEMDMNTNIRFLLVALGQLDTKMFSDIRPSNKFFAPLVCPDKFAMQICDYIRRGRNGLLCEPLYTNALLGVRCLPYSWQKFMRWFSHIDEKILGGQITDLQTISDVR